MLLDPNAKEQDFSDQKRCFVMDVLRQRDFAKQYPKAQKRSFTSEDTAAAPDWFASENILIAEYWRNDGYDPDTGAGGTITQYITNGLEILSRTKWPGSWIPIISVMGKKVYKPVGSEMKRFYYSQIRLARGPQMMLAYIASQEAEEFGMSPRAPFVGYVGQFETDSEAWETLNKVPRAFVQVDPMVDEASGQLLPLPTRPQFTPNAQAYEISKESWRRSIQASMGITPLPTAAQRQNEKSGIALDKIQSQEAIGSFHFTDNFDRAIENCGRQLDELITKVMDTPRQVGTRRPDDSHQMMHVVPTGQQPQVGPGEQPPDPDTMLDPQKGDFDITISTGMSYQSQREQASEFADTIVQNLKNLPIPPPAQAKLLAMAITLKDIGPIGDEISKIIDPPQDEPLPPQAQAAVAQAQQHAQLATQELQQLQQEKQSKMWEHLGKMKEIEAKFTADMSLEDKKLQTQLAVAEVETKAQNQSERIAAVEELVRQLHSQAHESAMAAQQAAHGQAAQEQQGQQQQDLAAQQGEQQSAQSAQDAQQQQDAQSADPAQGQE